MRLKYIESTITSYLHCKIHLIISDVKVVLSFVSDSGNKNIKVTVTYGFHLLQAMCQRHVCISQQRFSSSISAIFKDPGIFKIILIYFEYCYDYDDCE